MYTIYSIGDEAYLYKIFQFLAMLNSSGTTLYGRLGLLAALIGLILVIVALITSGGKRFEIGSYLIAIVLFLVFFQPTNVELIDFYTGRTDIVQDVPLGTALAFLLSAVGVSLPELVMLRSVMTVRLLVIFSAVVLAGTTLIGWMLNAFY